MSGGGRQRWRLLLVCGAAVGRAFGGGLERHGGALVLQAPRLEAHDEGEEVVVWDGRGGVGERTLVGQGAPLVLDAGTLRTMDINTIFLFPGYRS